jgi:hypothetical protein
MRGGLAPSLKSLLPNNRNNIYPYDGGSKRGEYGVPAKTKFWWGKKPPLYNQFPYIKRGNLKGLRPFKTYSSPSLTREGDKGGRLLRKYKGGGLINIKRGSLRGAKPLFLYFPFPLPRERG